MKPTTAELCAVLRRDARFYYDVGMGNGYRRTTGGLLYTADALRRAAKRLEAAARLERGEGTCAWRYMHEPSSPYGYSPSCSPDSRMMNPFTYCPLCGRQIAVVSNAAPEPPAAPDGEEMALRQAVENFSGKMLKKLLAKKAEGYHGWDDPAYREEVRAKLREHSYRLRKGDVAQAVDVANLAMMLDVMGPTVPAPAAPDPGRRPQLSVEVQEGYEPAPSAPPEEPPEVTEARNYVNQYRGSTATRMMEVTIDRLDAFRAEIATLRESLRLAEWAKAVWRDKAIERGKEAAKAREELRLAREERDQWKGAAKAWEETARIRGETMQERKRRQP